ncbi:MAG: glycosyl hydrolase, partial [Actinomycetota bacterium]|nr:glycosyl hydrolase [Actinomycetota bacterium]
MKHSFKADKRSRPRWVLPVSIGAGVVLVAAGLGGVWIARSSDNHAKNRAVAANDVYALADFPGWAKQNLTDTQTTFSVQSTAAKVGAVSLRIESSTPASVTPRQALVTPVAMVPNTDYTVSAWVDSGANKLSTSVIALGATTFAVPVTHSKWTKISFNVPSASSTTASLTISTSGPTGAVLLDGIEVAPSTGDANLVANGSFENYSSPTRITSNSLVLASGSAKVQVVAFGNTVSWSLLDESGVRAATGTGPIAAGKGDIDLSKMKQGYYTLSLHPTGSVHSAVSAPIIILDKVARGRKAVDVRFGIGVRMVASYNDGSEPLIAQLGFGAVRDDAYWPYVEAAPGSYAYPNFYEKAYAVYAKEGVQVLPIPDYANKLYDHGLTPSSPQGLAAYANFANAFVGHFSVPSVEIYNEPNGFSNGTCGTTPQCYVPLLKAAFEKIKSDHPNTLVVGPAIAFQDNTWLENFYKDGGLNYLDAVSIHPYGLQGAPEYLTKDLPLAAANIAKYSHGQSKPIWITELGYSTNTIGNGLSERTQASYLVRAEILSLSNGAQRFYAYNLVNDGLDPTDHQLNFGIFRSPTADVAAFTPKPSALTQAIAIREVSGKSYSRADSVGNTAFSYVYGSGANSTRVAWATTPKTPTTVEYSTVKPVTLVTEYGKKSTLVPVNGKVTVQLTAD